MKLYKKKNDTTEKHFSFKCVRYFTLENWLWNWLGCIKSFTCFLQWTPRSGWMISPIENYVILMHFLAKLQKSRQSVIVLKEEPKIELSTSFKINVCRVKKRSFNEKNLKITCVTTTFLEKNNISTFTSVTGLSVALSHLGRVHFFENQLRCLLHKTRGVPLPDQLYTRLIYCGRNKIYFSCWFYIWRQKRLFSDNIALK